MINTFIGTYIFKKLNNASDKTTLSWKFEKVEKIGIHPWTSQAGRLLSIKTNERKETREYVHNMINKRNVLKINPLTHILRKYSTFFTCKLCVRTFLIYWLQNTEFSLFFTHTHLVEKNTTLSNFYYQWKKFSLPIIVIFSAQFFFSHKYGMKEGDFFPVPCVVNRKRDFFKVHTRANFLHVKNKNYFACHESLSKISTF